MNKADSMDPAELLKVNSCVNELAYPDERRDSERTLPPATYDALLAMLTIVGVPCRPDPVYTVRGARAARRRGWGCALVRRAHGAAGAA